MPGPLKSRLFSIFGPFQLCLHTPSQTDKKLTPAVLERSCPRTYLPSRAGATHALRVLSSCAGAQRRRFLFRNRSFKRSSCSMSVRCPYVRKKHAKHPMVSHYLRRSRCQIPLGLFFSRFSRCRRKVRLRGEGMICRDLKKVDFFHLFAYIRRPRTTKSSLQPS